MNWIPDTVIDHLRQVLDEPDLSTTRYRMIGMAARGGMGTVYVVRDPDLDREVALKVLHVPDPGGDLARRLTRESRILGRLEHPNIVPVYEVGRLPDGRPFYTMRRILGARLDEWIKGGPTLSARLRLFQKICEAVAFAHSKGVIHRDLKPQNIMVGSYGEALVMDWGVAKVRDGPEPLESGPSSPRRDDLAASTAHGTLIGTPAFMSPEQARGDIERIDEASDVYSLGAILYFLLTGHPPFEGESISEIISRVIDGPPSAVRRYDRRIPRALESICLKALSRNPDHRYTGVMKLSEDVARHLDGEPVLAHRETFGERAMRIWSRHRGVAMLVVAYLIMRLILLITVGR